MHAFIAAIEDSGTWLVGLNFYAGDLAGPDCGVLSLSDRVPLCVPTTTSSSCDRGVFVEDAAESVVSLDANLVEVDRFR